VLAAPAASRACKKSTRVSHHRFNRNTRPSLRDGVNASCALSSVSMTLLVTVASRVSARRARRADVAIPRDLAPAQGCQDHTPSPSAATSFVELKWLSVHRIPPHVRDDASVPLAEAGWRKEKHDFRKNEIDIFFTKGVYTKSQSSLVGQIISAKPLNGREISCGDARSWSRKTAGTRALIWRLGTPHFATGNRGKVVAAPCDIVGLLHRAAAR
jgi:hypothetical protein